MTTWDGKELPAPSGRGVLSDRFYYRGDEAAIKKFINNPMPCSVYLGLRRFGKTSVLRRVQRWVNGRVADEPLKIEGCKAYFVSTTASFANDIEEGLRDTFDGTKLFLIDDLQHLDNPWNDGERIRDSIVKAVQKLFRAAGQDFKKTRIMLCEPTNHLEWLAGVKTAGPGRLCAGPAILEAADASITNIFGHMNKLNTDEGLALLSGAPPDAGQREGALFVFEDESAALSVYNAFGGNPYFLAYAHLLLKKLEGSNFAKKSVLITDEKVGEFISKVNDGIKGTVRADGGDDNDRASLKTIYHTLSRPERLIVDLLHWYETLKGRIPNPAAEYFCDQKNIEDMKHNWKNKAVPLHRQLVDMGVADGAKGWATGLTSQPLMDVISIEHSLVGRTIMDDFDSIDRDVWQEHLNLPHPSDTFNSKVIIHHFGDLFFDSNGNNPYWDKYVEWLKVDDSLEKRRWPHFIVICGNILAGSFDKERTERFAADDEYERGLDRALKKISTVTRYLRPVSNTPSAKKSQIILVPGIMDINWKEDVTTVEDYRRKSWNIAMQSYGFGPKIRDEPDGQTIYDPAVFPIQRVAFIPFDTVGLFDVGTALGGHAIEDISFIRRQIRYKFGEEYSRFQEEYHNQNDPVQKLRRDLLLFIANEWRYVIMPERNKDPKLEPTFTWSDTDKKPWASEAGFVSDETINNMLKKTKETIIDANVNGGKVLKIAVMHHCPRQMGKGTLVEFHRAFGFRQLIGNGGVDWILHGHSPRPQQLSDVINQPGGAIPSRKLEMLGPGSMSPMRDFGVAFGAQVTEVGTPAFNEIQVTPPSRNSENTGSRDSEFRVEVRIFEWRDNETKVPTMIDGTWGHAASLP
jgi:hypothetical protein